MNDIRSTVAMGLQFGILARESCGVKLPLQVLQSEKGFYIGTADDSGPVSRESMEYWSSKEKAETALSGGGDFWNQRDHL